MFDSSAGIFSQVHRYLSGEASLAELEDWIVPRLGELLADPRSTAHELAGTIELGLAEMAAGDLDEEGFRSLLREFAATHRTLVLRITPGASWTGSSNKYLASPSLRIPFGLTPGRSVRYERIRLGEAA